MGFRGMWSAMRLLRIANGIEYRARRDECRRAKRVVATGQRARNSNDGHTGSAFAFLQPSSLLARYSIFICCATEASAMTSRNLPAQPDAVLWRGQAHLPQGRPRITCRNAAGLAFWIAQEFDVGQSHAADEHIVRPLHVIRWQKPVSSKECHDVVLIHTVTTDSESADQ